MRALALHCTDLLLDILGGGLLIGAINLPLFDGGFFASFRKEVADVMTLARVDFAMELSRVGRSPWALGGPDPHQPKNVDEAFPKNSSDSL
jgi:hypothetical protein